MQENTELAEAFKNDIYADPVHFYLVWTIVCHAAYRFLMCIVGVETSRIFIVII